MVTLLHVGLLLNEAGFFYWAMPAQRTGHLNPGIASLRLNPKRNSVQKVKE